MLRAQFPRIHTVERTDELSSDLNIHTHIHSKKCFKKLSVIKAPDPGKGLHDSKAEMARRGELARSRACVLKLLTRLRVE